MSQLKEGHICQVIMNRTNAKGKDTYYHNYALGTIVKVIRYAPPVCTCEFISGSMTDGGSNRSQYLYDYCLSPASKYGNQFT